VVLCQDVWPSKSGGYSYLEYHPREFQHVNRPPTPPNLVCGTIWSTAPWAATRLMEQTLRSGFLALRRTGITPLRGVGRSVRLSLPPEGGRPVLVHPAPYECPSYGQAGQGNLKQGRLRWTRKTYGPDQIRYQGRIRWIRCLSCQSEFSERKNPPKGGQGRLRWTRRVRTPSGGPRL